LQGELLHPVLHLPHHPHRPQFPLPGLTKRSQMHLS
jgi:hypothetical protein